MAPSKALRYVTSTRPLADEPLDVIAVPVFKGGEVPAEALAALGPASDLERIAVRLQPRAAGWSSWVSTGPSAPDLLLICVGPATGREAHPDGLRLAAMVAGRTANRQRVASLLVTARASDPDAATTVAEGWVMGAYRFDGYRGDPTPAMAEEVVMWGCDQLAVETGVIVGEAAATARDLVNTPPGDLTPSALADACRELGAHHNFTVTVLERGELERERFGGLLVVGAGSVNQPVLIQLERGDLEREHLALVGKGITFDAGGLSLKTTAQMRTMKGDMSGAASIVGALVAADRLGLPNHVRAYLACAENMPGSAAVRVGDVIRHRNGLTTEVVDTDCEGRLVLADALAYAVESRPTHLIDVATLSSNTGLGPELWALLATDPELARRLLAAGAASGEPGWQLPLWDGYVRRLRSDVADLRNFDPGSGSSFAAVFAALYLRHFVSEVPWAHIDLGVTNMRTEATSAWRAGANGNGTRTLARYLHATAVSGDASGTDAPDAGRKLVRLNEPGPTGAGNNRASIRRAARGGELQ